MAITVLINSVDVGSRVLPSSVQWSRVRFQRGMASMTLKMPVGDTMEPVQGQSVVIKDSGNTVWTGSINSLTWKFMGDSGWRSWELTCVSMEQRLDLLFIDPRVYTSTNAGAIVSDLLSSVGAGQGISAGTISAGASITKLYYDWQRLSDAIEELGKQSGFKPFINTSNQLQFTSPTAFAAPFTLTDAKALQKNLMVDVSRVDRRNRQRIRINFAAFAPVVEVFAGDGATQNFTLPKPVNRVESVAIYTGYTQSSEQGTFTGLPSNGDTVTIGGVAYVFKTTIDNKAFGEVLIGGSAAACCQNLADAINDSGSGKGTTYSLPTWGHFTAQASVSTATLTITARTPGTSGDGITLAESCANFTWAAGSTSGGVDGTITEQTVGILNVDEGKDWYYSPGEAGLYNDTGPMVVGASGVVAYRPLGGDVISVEDSPLISTTASTEGTTGVYEHLIEDTQATDVGLSLDRINKILEAYRNDGVTLNMQTDDPGLEPGMLLTVSLSSPYNVLNDDWLIQEVSGTYSGTGDRDHFRYTIKAIDGTRQGSELEVFEQMASGGGSSSASAALAVGGGVVGDDQVVWDENGASITY